MDPALITAIATLGGVAITLWYNRAVTKNQLSHDASQRRAERVHELRKEVFLKATRSIPAANAFLSGLCDLENYGEADFSPLADLFTSISEVSFVAEQRTVAVAGSLQVEYSAAYLRLLAELGDVRRVRVNIDVEESLFCRAKDELEQCKQRRSDYYSDGRTKASAEAVQLREAVLHHEELLNEIRRTQCSLDQEMQVLKEKYRITFIDEMKRLNGTVVSLLVAMREDVGLVSDRFALERQLRESWDRINEEIPAAITTFKDKMLKSG